MTPQDIDSVLADFESRIAAMEKSVKSVKAAQYALEQSYSEMKGLAEELRLIKQQKGNLQQCAAQTGLP